MKRAVVTPAPIKLGITGFPLHSTGSPGLHRGFLRSAKRRGSYDVLPFDPALGRRAFFHFLDSCRRQGYVGLNVTVPHKEWAYEYCMRHGRMTSDVHGKSAKLAGAVNTLVFARGAVLGANTDAMGLWSEVRGWFETLYRRNRSLDLVIVGTGGSARGALAGVMAGSAKPLCVSSIRVIGRDPTKERSLCRIAGRFAFARQAPDERLLLVVWCLPPIPKKNARDLLVQATENYDSGAVHLYDLNYGERAMATKGLVTARRRRGGMGMLRAQARASFALWLKSSS